jgi:hypothetical protein
MWDAGCGACAWHRLQGDSGADWCGASMPWQLRQLSTTARSTAIAGAPAAWWHEAQSIGGCVSWLKLSAA